MNLVTANVISLEKAALQQAEEILDQVSYELKDNETHSEEFKVALHTLRSQWAILIHRK